MALIVGIIAWLLIEDGVFAPKPFHVYWQRVYHVRKDCPDTKLVPAGGWTSGTGDREPCPVCVGIGHIR